MPDNDEILNKFYVNEEKLNSCPRVPICIGNQHIPAVIDTGRQVSLLTEELYHKLRSEGVEALELCVQNAVLVSAFGNKTRRIRAQAMLPIRIGDIVADHIFLISP
jgi:isopentenyl phosphate kinase